MKMVRTVIFSWFRVLIGERDEDIMRVQGTEGSVKSLGVSW